MLLPEGAAEEDDHVLPAVADPALVAVVALPASLGVHFEVRILRVALIENQLWMSQLASDDERLHRLMLSAETSLHAALDVVLGSLEVSNLDCVGDSSSCVLVRVQHVFGFVRQQLIIKAPVLLVLLGVFDVFKLLLHFDLESSHGVSLQLPRIELASNGEVLGGVVDALDAKHHQHVDLDRLRDVVVAQVDSLQCLALRERPLNRFDVATEVHSAEVDVNQLRGRGDHVDQMAQELLQPVVVLGEGVVAQVQVLHLLAVVRDDLHDVGELATVNVDVAEVQLLNVRHRAHHCFERLHEDELVDLQVGEAEPHELVAALGEGAEEHIQVMLASFDSRDTHIIDLAFMRTADQLLKLFD